MPEGAKKKITKKNSARIVEISTRHVRNTKKKRCLPDGVLRCGNENEFEKALDYGICMLTAPVTRWCSLVR